MEKMNPAIKTTWLEALRSGKYQQARNRLGNLEKGMCCLGVLCHVQGLDMTSLVPIDDDPEYKRAIESLEYPPKSYLAGLNKDQCENLAEMNDDLDYNFKQIADFVEANY